MIMEKLDVIQIRIDPSEKKAALAEAQRRSTTISDLIRDFLKRLVKEGKLK